MDIGHPHNRPKRVACTGLGLVVGFLLPFTAAAQESKPLPELDALRLERAELEVRALTAEIQARQERIERIKSEAIPYLAGLRQRDKADGCQLDLGNRKWVCPKAEDKPANSGQPAAGSVPEKKE